MVTDKPVYMVAQCVRHVRSYITPLNTFVHETETPVVHALVVQVCGSCSKIFTHCVGFVSVSASGEAGGMCWKVYMGGAGWANQKYQTQVKYFCRLRLFQWNRITCNTTSYIKSNTIHAAFSGASPGPGQGRLDLSRDRLRWSAADGCELLALRADLPHRRRERRGRALGSRVQPLRHHAHGKCAARAPSVLQGSVVTSLEHNKWRYVVLD